MPKNPPNLVAINHDNYHASHVGQTNDGRQFFLTNPFIPAMKGNLGREFVALFLFDQRGGFVEARIDDLGTRADMNHEQARRAFEKWLGELGSVKYGRIEIRPFQVERFGVSFGLIPRPPEEDDSSWWVEIHPGNYMASSEPFDSGEYDT
jgi:hypothetical protein